MEMDRLRREEGLGLATAAYSTVGYCCRRALVYDQQDARQRSVENQRAQDTALQAYLDQMGELILKRDLLESEEGDPAYILAQARTSTAIRRLDAEHNKSVIRFLTDSGLTGSPVAATSGEESPISILRKIDLSGTALRGADLTKADLRDATLRNTDLRYASLTGADLRGAFLYKANLRGTDLEGADLSGPYSRGSNEGAYLSEANLSYASLSNADLSNASLSEANLSYANLYDTDLRGAYLSEANLSYASLSGADLSGATLDDATMPNGQKYEDWIKDREGRK
jgi:uncharacterized protein YjbI with pentapeptide repeats